MTDKQRKSLAQELIFKSPLFRDLVNESINKINVLQFYNENKNQINLEKEPSSKLFIDNFIYLINAYLSDLKNSFNIEIEKGALEVRISQFDKQSIINLEFHAKINKVQYRHKIEIFNFNKDKINQRFEEYINLFDSFSFHWKAGRYIFGPYSDHNLFDYYNLYPQDLIYNLEPILGDLGAGGRNSKFLYGNDYKNYISSFGSSEIENVKVPKHLTGIVQAFIVNHASFLDSLSGKTDVQIKVCGSIFYDDKLSVLYINNVPIEFIEGSNIAVTIKHLLRNLDEFVEWDFTQISEEIDREDDFDPKRIRNLIASINNRIASAGFPEFLKIKNSMVRINQKYLRL